MQHFFCVTLQGIGIQLITLFVSVFSYQLFFFAPTCLVWTWVHKKNDVNLILIKMQLKFVIGTNGSRSFFLMWFCDWLVASIVQMGNFSQMNKRNWFPFTWLILWGIFHCHSWCCLPLFVLLLWGYVWWTGLAGLWSIIFDEVDGFSHHSFAKLDIQFELRSFLIDFDWGECWRDESFC